MAVPHRAMSASPCSENLLRICQAHDRFRDLTARIRAEAAEIGTALDAMRDGVHESA